MTVPRNLQEFLQSGVGGTFQGFSQGIKVLTALFKRWQGGAWRVLLGNAAGS